MVKKDNYIIILYFPLRFWSWNLLVCPHSLNK